MLYSEFFRGAYELIKEAREGIGNAAIGVAIAFAIYAPLHLARESILSSLRAPGRKNVESRV